MSSSSLSIVIPALGSLDLLEPTLVSVLQNRPHGCEVVVVLNRAYDDPYGLAGEVRFLEAREARNVAEALNAALKICRGAVVHVLAVGTEVDEGWTEPALKHFLDHRIAAVAPLVLKDRESLHVCSAGLEYTAGGRRRQSLHGAALAEVTGAPVDTLGPTHLAGFYRRDALSKLVQPFAVSVGDRLWDVDTALQLKHAGYRAVVEPQSMAYRQAAALSPVSPFTAGRQAARLFWRNLPVVGKLKSLAARPLALLGELFEAGPIGAKLSRLLGRSAALAEAISYRRHHRALEAVGKPGLAYAVVSTGDRIRIDGAHPHSTAAAKAKPTADRRRDDDAGRAA